MQGFFDVKHLIRTLYPVSGREGFPFRRPLAYVSFSEKKCRGKKTKQDKIPRLGQYIPYLSFVKLKPVDNSRLPKLWYCALILAIRLV